MVELRIQNVPDELYRSLEQLAAADQLPPATEALRLLEEAVARKQALNGSGTAQREARSQREILDEIIRHRYAPAAGTPDSVELLREDRQR